MALNLIVLTKFRKNWLFMTKHQDFQKWVFILIVLETLFHWFFTLILRSYKKWNDEIDASKFFCSRIWKCSHLLSSPWVIDSVWIMMKRRWKPWNLKSEVWKVLVLDEVRKIILFLFKLLIIQAAKRISTINLEWYRRKNRIIWRKEEQKLEL